MGSSSCEVRRRPACSPEAASAACGCKGVVQAAVGWATGAKTRPSQARSPARRCPRGGCASTTATPFIPAKAGIQGHKRVHARLRRAMALGPRFRGDERKRACGKTHTLYFFQTAQPVSPARRVDDCRHKLQSWRLRYSNCVRDHNDRAGRRARAPDVACDRRGRTRPADGDDHPRAERIAALRCVARVAGGHAAGLARRFPGPHAALRRRSARAVRAGFDRRPGEVGGALDQREAARSGCLSAAVAAWSCVLHITAMSEHRVTLKWQRGGAEFSYQKYPRDHTWTFDGGHTMTATAAPAYLGNPANVDPEEAFVASLSSCHMLTFLAIACRQKFVLDAYEDRAVGHMAKNAEGKMAITRVELRPRIVWSGDRRPSAEELDKMHHAAHENCFIANSVKTEVTVMKE